MPFFSAWILFDAARKRQWRPLLRWAAVVVAALLSAVKVLPTVQFTWLSPRDVRRDQRTPKSIVLVALLDPRQAFLYRAVRDRQLPDGHYAKSFARAEAAPAIDYLFGHEEVEWFHEYSCCVGGVGILLAAWGGMRTIRRLWPLYGAGLWAGIVILGASSPVDLWSAMRHLPLYGQLQVPSRFMAALVFVLAVAVAFPMEAVAERTNGRLHNWRRAGEVLLIAALYSELALLGWSLFDDVFVIPRANIEGHRDFALRFTTRSIDPIVMYSTMHGCVRSNSGTLDAYENLSVAHGSVRTVYDRLYRGAAYLEGAGGAAIISSWTMSEVSINVQSPATDNLIPDLLT